MLQALLYRKLENKRITVKKQKTTKKKLKKKLKKKQQNSQENTEQANSTTESQQQEQTASSDTVETETQAEAQPEAQAEPQPESPVDTSANHICEKDGYVDDYWVGQVNYELETIPASLVQQFQADGWHIYCTDMNIDAVYYGGNMGLLRPLLTTMNIGSLLRIDRMRSVTLRSMNLVIGMIGILGPSQIPMNS